MSFGLIIEADVREEMRDAGDWYESRETGVGGRFAVAVDQYLQQILSDPFRYPKAGPTTHKAKILGWPYSIFFTILEEQRLVKIIAVWQGNQDPAELRRRLK
ncbi:MAG TPA: type II toxin-antitoxin system RelE/ParE family toxin [Verrucomicrobiae bacterium]